MLAKLGIKDPLLDIAKKLEEAALKDPYFVARKLYPNVDFYSGIIYRALGFPTNMFTVIFALGRLPGWIAHWKEMSEAPATKIGRPRQIYTGPPCTTTCRWTPGNARLRTLASRLRGFAGRSLRGSPAARFAASPLSRFARLFRARRRRRGGGAYVSPPLASLRLFRRGRRGCEAYVSAARERESSAANSESERPASSRRGDVAAPPPLVWASRGSAAPSAHRPGSQGHPVESPPVGHPARAPTRVEHQLRGVAPSRPLERRRRQIWKGCTGA